MENGFNLDLQLALDQLPEDLDSLIVYLPNSKLALDQDFYSSPVLPEIRIGELSTETTPSQFLKTKSNRFFAINESGVLDTISRAANEYVEFDFSKKSIPFLINNSTSESRYINAALESISEIYGFDFQQTENLDSAELIFSENLPQIFDQKKLYFISNSRVYPEFENQIVLEDSLVFSQSELIRKGRLPEFLLEKFLNHIGFKEKSSAIDLVQLEKRFLTKGKNSSTQKANLNEWLMILLLGTLVIERYLSNKQGI